MRLDARSLIVGLDPHSFASTLLFLQPSPASKTAGHATIVDDLPRATELIGVDVNLSSNVGHHARSADARRCFARNDRRHPASVNRGKAERGADHRLDTRGRPGRIER